MHFPGKQKFCEKVVLPSGSMNANCNSCLSVSVFLLQYFLNLVKIHLLNPYRSIGPQIYILYIPSHSRFAYTKQLCSCDDFLHQSSTDSLDNDMILDLLKLFFFIFLLTMTKVPTLIFLTSIVDTSYLISFTAY